MNKTVSEAETLLKTFMSLVSDLPDTEVAFAPPFPALPIVHSLISNSPFNLAAQNMYWEEEGAYTGEISGRMLKDLGCQYVILGHSERRQLLGETNEIVNRKVQTALKHQLHPILCLGESLEDRENHHTQSVVENQVREGLKNVTAKDVESVTLAYEPIWAIGTGRAATLEQIEDVHKFLRTIVEKQFGQPSVPLRILYGGSVTPSNAPELFGSAQVNGGLIGKACLNPETFATLVKLASTKIS
jgi:triosephosphate isomerase